ncbi:MAG: NAD-dependent epimerase/dehydratase family protein [Saprospiraceae bacterium]
MSNKKVLVTGATGLLGSNIAAELLDRGYDVRVLMRKSSNPIALNGLDVEVMYGDIINEEDVLAAGKGCVAIIHSAANTSQWGPELAFHDAVNVQGTQNVINAVKKWDMERLVHVSTANTFRPGSLQQPGDEMGDFSYTVLRTDYIDTKNQAQQIVKDAVKNEGIPAIIVNPTFMIGGRDAKPSSGKMVLYYLRTPVVMCPTGGKNFVPVRDAAAGAVNALDHGRFGECYLLANENLNYRQFFTLIGQVSGRRKPFFTAPPGFLKTVGRTGDMISNVIGRKIPVSYANSSLLTIDNYYTPKKAVDELKMPQTPLAEAIADAVSWFAANKYF